jgi:undecaprenyl diphosphate synthase
MSIPQHIAIIMDGNGRWAKRRMMPRSVGHLRGAANLRSAARWCATHGVRYLTVFAFSTENWRRPPEEVSMLMELFGQYLEREIAALVDADIRLRVIGDRSGFDPDIQSRIAHAEAATADQTRFHLTIAANYGGQWDILQAMRRWQAQHPGRDVSELTEQALAAHLSTADLPEPDLLIRTGGEQRISNFMIWQMAYTELYFTDVFWPEFKEEHFEKALLSYQSRVRRFGQTDEQVAQGLLSARQA